MAKGEIVLDFRAPVIDAAAGWNLTVIVTRKKARGWWWGATTSETFDHAVSSARRSGWDALKRDGEHGPPSPIKVAVRAAQQSLKEEQDVS